MQRTAGILGSCLLGALLASAVSVGAQSDTMGAPCRQHLPDPTGPRPVGTRLERIVVHPRPGSTNGREVLVQYWYPRKEDHAAPSAAAPYLAEPGLAAALLTQGYYDQDSSVIRGWECVRVPAILDAPVADGTFPLITVSVGLGVIRANYSLLATDLASHGYIVAMVESPLAGLMISSTGAVVQDTSAAAEDPRVHEQRVADWARDLRLVLNHIDNAEGRTEDLRRVVNWSQIGAIGHSTGGLVAIQACEDDARIRACVDMDGGLVTPENAPLAPFVRTGTSHPVLVLRSRPLYSDADLAKRGLTREQWVKRGGAGVNAWDSLAARSRGSIRVASIAGTGHMSFSDAPFVMPNTITRFGGTIIDPARGAEVIGRMIRAFFDEELAQGPQTVDGAVAALPEVELKVLR